jgi:hypothetical protein
VFEEYRIDEASRRWPDFQGGQAIELPDGQTWRFYEPAAMTRGGMPGWTFGAGVPHDIDAILSDRFGRIVVKWGRAADDRERASAMLEAAWFLLARNYAVTAGEFERIVAGASAWEDSRQGRLGAQLLMLVGTACSRATAFQGAA